VTTRARGTSPVLIIGPTPPPYNGMSVATDAVLGGLSGSMPILHLDTADRRDLSNMGRVDWTNIRLALEHGIKFLSLVLRRKPSAIYIPISQAWLPFMRDCLFLIPARLLRMPVVVHLHGSYFPEFYKQSPTPMKWLIRYALENVRTAIVLGDTLVGAFDGVIDRERVRVVPNGLPDYVNGAQKVNQGRTACRVLFLATLLKEKGVLDLLRAVPSVLKVVNCLFTFAGEWYRHTDKATAEQLVRDLAITEYVDFRGPVGPDAKRELFLSSDVFVLPTYYPYEGHPFVILEAMCAGLPVVTTNAGCIEETVKDGMTGLIVRKQDPDSIAQAIIRLLTDAKLRACMGNAGRERFLAMYTSSKFSERIEAVLHQAAGPLVTEPPQ